ncbi:DMT family transporter [Agrobacterium vitis]|uniref:DMT family transporter n=1 Tax=Agrobacterium vitis TaxID=373 RepID=UPI0020364069|nr:DMT family transporter [Agrobacterium vitis]MCM2453611.1 DMT family transporter [Agrobacterium vitis]
MTLRSNVNPKLEIVLLLVLATMWAPAYALINIGVQTIPPLTLMSVRTVLAALVLLIYMHVTKQSLPRSCAIWSRALLQALVYTVIPFTLIAWGSQYVPSGNVAIVQAAPPIFVFLLTAVFTRHEETSLRRLLGVILGLIGICVVVFSSRAVSADVEVLAYAALILATVSYALAAILGSKAFGDTNPLIVAVCTMIMASAILVPASLTVDMPATLRPSWASSIAAVTLAVVSTAIPFLIYFRLLRTIGAIGTSVQSYLRVPMAIAIGAMLLGEKLPAESYAGMVLILVSVYLTNVKRRTAAILPDNAKTETAK